MLGKILNEGSLMYKADPYEVLWPLTLSFLALLQPAAGPTRHTHTLYSWKQDSH